MSDRYKLVFKGEYAAGIDPVEVVTHLEELFRLPRVRVLGMIARPPCVIREGMSKVAAEQERITLEEAGLLTVLETDETSSPPWDGVERRLGERRSSSDRRTKQDDDLRGERRHRGRRSTDYE